MMTKFNSKYATGVSFFIIKNKDVERKKLDAIFLKAKPFCKQANLWKPLFPNQGTSRKIISGKMSKLKLCTITLLPLRIKG